MRLALHRVNKKSHPGRDPIRTRMTSSPQPPRLPCESSGMALVLVLNAYRTRPKHLSAHDKPTAPLCNSQCSQFYVSSRASQNRWHSSSHITELRICHYVLYAKPDTQAMIHELLLVPYRPQQKTLDNNNRIIDSRKTASR